MNANERIEPRDLRALTEYLTVLDDVGRVRGADGLYLVVSQSGKEYLFDAHEGACECPDAQYRGVRCKHVRRVEFATGNRAILGSVDPSSIDEQIGLHVAGTPRVAVADGGTLSKAENRPDDCDCAPSFEDLPCWPCYRDGFHEPNPNEE